MSTVQSAMAVITPTGRDTNGEPLAVGSLHPCYRSLDEMPDVARAFHERAAEISGLVADDLVHAVFDLEELLMKRKRKQEGQNRRPDSADERS